MLKKVNMIRKFEYIIMFIVMIMYIPFAKSAPHKLALIIGNSSYLEAPLKNPVNDANDMALALRKLDFEVIIKTNANLVQMESAIEKFGRRLEQTTGVGLFYYAGHGIQSKGENYLIPVKTNINRETELRYKAVNASRILDEMEYANNGLNIAILDACRNNPLTRSFRSRSRGLARINRAPKGLFLVYSTDPGNVAMDGDGRNSPFTSELIKAINLPLPIELVFKEVRKNVQKLTENKQTPFTTSSLSGDFYFTKNGQLQNIKNSLTSNDATKQNYLSEWEPKISFDGRVAIIKISNTSLYDITVSLWHPDSKKLFKSYLIGAQKSMILEYNGNPINIGSDWGIQIGSKRSSVKTIASVAKWEKNGQKNFWYLTPDMFFGQSK